MSKEPKSNTRRFVNAAWALLSFQFIASMGAVAVTGVAAFYVQGKLQELQTAQMQPEPAIPDEGDTGKPPGVDATDAGTEGAAEQTAQDAQAAAAAAEQAQAEAAPAYASCPLGDGAVRVMASAGWCDTGIDLNEGDTVLISEVGGRWSNAGEPTLGPEGHRGTPWDGTVVVGADLGSLVGQVGGRSFPIGGSHTFISPGAGRLLFAMNDSYYPDNQGWIVVHIQDIQRRVNVQ